MKNYHVRVLAIISVFFSFVGCGGGGSQNLGQGKTVNLSSSITSGTSLAASTSVSNFSDMAGLSYTLTSVPLSNINGTITASDIAITNYKVTYTYTGNANSSDNNKYPIPEFSLNLGGKVPAGGTLLLSGSPMIQPAVKDYIQKNYSAVFSNFSGNVLTYNATVTFSGNEINTNTPISTTTNATVWISK
ncbi:hypothetical protein [Oryzomonas rubra]|uniref:Lipoprotein n=1 Tax=Oryzomonas rubra TaxID=2509454 RepID=A0A5A9X8V3_9BACT|nr:hypothetical protein [Oryzomonas rubra]KAA0888835.1 hypothetical protein ET418_15770 [Oryzomonas rubra]